MNPFYPHLFESYTIRGHRFRNRIIMAPFLPQNADENGIPSDYGMAYYERRARGGAAQLTIGETPVDFDRSSRKKGGFIDLTRDDYLVREVCMISELTSMMHQHHTIAGIELSYIGMWNMPETIRDHKNPVGPDQWVRPDGVQVDALTPEEMEEIAAHFAHAAKNAKQFGFDSVMVHGGHGWLQSQFLSPLFNHRTDEYGGSLENRARFPLMILRAVRQAIGEDTILEYRVSAEELVPGGISLEETIQFLKMAQDDIDLVHVSVGCYQNPVQTRTFPSVYEPYGCNAHLAAAIKRELHIPVAVVGAINTPEVAEDIVPCIRCYRCMGIPGKSPNIFCSVNPSAAREARAPYLNPYPGHMRLLIAGGGPGGMPAALTTAQVGHSVVLCEAEDSLGGALRFTEHDPNKKDLHKYLNYLISHVMAEPRIEVRLNTPVSAELIGAEQLDAVFISIGAEPVVPGISVDEGASVIQAVDAYSCPDRLGKKIVIIGAGLVGCELGVFLRDLGKQVTILEAGGAFAPDCVGFPRMALEAQLQDRIRLVLNTPVTEVTGGFVRAGDRAFRADAVILACGMKAKAEETGRLLEVCPESVAIGDCVRPRKVLDAVHEGYFAAIDL